MNALQKLQADWDAAARYAADHDLPPPPDDRPTVMLLVAGGCGLFFLMVVVLALVVAFGPDLAR